MPELTSLFGLVARETARRGGGAAELCVVRERTRRYDSRSGGIDSLSFSDTLSLGIRVFRDGRMGFSYGFRAGDDEIVRMVEAALFSAASADPDPANGLPGGDGGFPELSLHDPECEGVGEREKAEFAVRMERDALSRDPRMKRVRTATLVETVGETAFRNSAGRFGAARESRYAAWIEAVAEDGAEGQTGYGYGFSRRFSGLDAGDIAVEAAGKALRMLGPQRLQTGRYAAILENAVAAELLEVLAPSFLASNVVKGRSILSGKIGNTVASEIVHICDDPLDPSGSGAAKFDAEGTPCRRNVLVQGGVLRGFLADSFWGKKLGTGTTASLRRTSPKVPPAVGISNLRISAGDRTLAEMMRNLGTGVLVTELLGIHTADPVSGDFSVGAAGIRFDEGEEREPVRGFAVSGNVLSLLSKVTDAGSDFRWFGNAGAPSLAISCIEVGGE
ncbi:MAG: TldD/PmbA family protein [Deltaproteobacteria bacterium]|nr:TldD/PmbA family protein [Deltaproteobacteria bacterium]